VIEVDGEPLVDSRRLRAPGRHNQWNLCGAVAGTMLLEGRPPSAHSVAAAVDAFEGLPSRCHTIGRRDGLTFVDDALASNPFATMASVEAFPGRPLTVILGGADRGIDVGPLAEALARRSPIPTVVVLPPDGQRLRVALDSLPADRPPVPVREADDMVGAVREAVASTAGGGVILFSPAAPTPDGQGGFRERSRQFAAASGVPVPPVPVPGPGS
jgi:UDP-N-acetylmuramoylalanine--D-glutamate ligase